MLDLFSKLSELGAPRAFFFSDPASGLRCVLVIDDVRLGPAAGGVRTRADASVETALEDAASLALLLANVDVLAPCAVGQVIDTALAGRIHAWGVCGAANGVLASEDAGRVLHERGVLLVPDVVASAGAVVDGIGRSVMELEDRRPLIDQLGVLAGRILERSEIEDRPSTEVAEALAHERLDHSEREA